MFFLSTVFLKYRRPNSATAAVSDEVAWSSLSRTELTSLSGRACNLVRRVRIVRQFLRPNEFDGPGFGGSLSGPVRGRHIELGNGAIRDDRQRLDLAKRGLQVVDHLASLFQRQDAPAGRDAEIEQPGIALHRDVQCRAVIGDRNR